MIDLYFYENFAQPQLIPANKADERIDTQFTVTDGTDSFVVSGPVV